jgi:hypothetical protein
VAALGDGMRNVDWAIIILCAEETGFLESVPLVPGFLKQMMEETGEFKVSAGELECLKQLVSHDESLAGLLRFHEGAPGRSLTIRLSRAEAEQLRDSLTTQLAAVGFDQNDSPNEQGRMLEELIDRFYVPCAPRAESPLRCSSGVKRRSESPRCSLPGEKKDM